MASGKIYLKNVAKKHLYFLISAIGLLTFTAIILSLNSDFSLESLPPANTVKTNIPNATKLASPSATPTPTPLPIPQNYGRQVTVPILLYHYVGENPNPADKARDNLSVNPETFNAQMDYLAKAGYTPISLDTMYAGLKGNIGLPGRAIVLTFDDGYTDFYYNAYPILKRHNFHATEFIPTGLINQGYYLTWDQIREMDGSGLISFQTHSVNHVNLAGLPYDKLVYQLTESKKVLQSQLGKTVNFMAYPYGTSNAATWEAVKQAGYLGAAGTWYGTTTSEGTVFDMPRVKIPGGITVENFAKRF